MRSRASDARGWQVQEPWQRQATGAAALEDDQAALVRFVRGAFASYFGRQENLDDPAVLAALCLVPVPRSVRAPVVLGQVGVEVAGNGRHWRAYGVKACAAAMPAASAASESTTLARM